MKKTTPKICECCGAKIVKYRHGLSKLLVRILKISWNQSDRATLPFRVSSNDSYTYSEASNFQKLRYWGFVESCSGELEGSWKLTDKAIDFIFGKYKAPKNVWTYRGDVVFDKDDETVPLISLREVDPSWPIERRIDYAKNAKSISENEDNQLSLLEN